MTQGLLLFDSAQRLVICNQRYIEMYGLSAEVIKPGCSFHDVITHRKQTGSFNGDVDHYVRLVLRDIAHRNVMVIATPDGRSIQIVNEPLADGGWVATHEDVTERQRAEQRITHLAHYDALTDLPNRALFHEQLKRELPHAAPGQQLAVLYIDIDEFKSVNDSLGHMIGDELLKSVAIGLRACVRETDFVARLGGDEFAIVQTGVTDPAEITGLVHRVFDAIRAPFECLGHQVTTDASIGIALAPRDGTDLDQILKNADLAMYAAKAAGRRTYRFLRSRDGSRSPRPPHPRNRPAPGHHRRRLRGLLPALSEPAGRQHYRLRGAAALASSAARHDLAGRLHSDRRGNRPDQPARRMGADHRLPRGRDLARAHSSCGQRLAGAVQERHAGAEGDCRAGRLGPCRRPAGTRNHRSRPDPRRRRRARHPAPACATSASASRSTISAPAIPR